MPNVGPPNGMNVLLPGTPERSLSPFDHSVPLRDFVTAAKCTAFKPDKNYVYMHCTWGVHDEEHVIAIYRKEAKLDKLPAGSPPSDPELPFSIVLLVTFLPEHFPRFTDLRSDPKLMEHLLKALAPDMAEANITIGEKEPYLRVVGLAPVQHK